MRFLRPLFGALLLISLAGVGLGTTRTRTDEITSSDDGRVSFPGGIIVPTAPSAPVSNATFYSSATYSATVTAGTNVDSATTPATGLHYDRAGNSVHVWGRVGLNPTSGSATLTTFTLSLPVPPLPFSSSAKATGTAGLPTTIANGVCKATAGGQTVSCTYGAVSTTSDLVNVNFTYSVQ